MYAEVKNYGKKESSIHEFVKKEIHASFAIASQTVKVMAIAHKCLDQMEKAFNLW